MRDRIRSRAITIVVLLVTFVVMMAALAYNPAKSGEASVHVHGKVTDEYGTPLANATVVFQEAGHSIMRTAMSYTQYRTTDDNGRFSAELSSKQFGIPGKVLCVAYTSQDSRWTQGRNITLIEGRSAIELNFVLVNSTKAFLPVGPIVLASTMAGQTQIEVSTYIANLNQYSFTCPADIGTTISPRKITINEISENGSLILNGIHGYISGTYYDVSDGKYEVESSMLSISSLDTTNTLSNKMIAADYIDPISVTEQSMFFSLTKGQNKTISASPDHNITLPGMLSPEVDTIVIGKKTITYNYSDWYRGTDHEFVHDDDTLISVTITPLSPGTHSYQVYVEQNYIIHIWEL